MTSTAFQFDSTQQPNCDFLYGISLRGARHRMCYVINVEKVKVSDC